VLEVVGRYLGEVAGLMQRECPVWAECDIALTRDYAFAAEDLAVRG